MGTVAKDFQNVQKALTSMEAKIDQKKAERHSILKQSKVFHLSKCRESLFNISFFLDGRYSNTHVSR